MVNFLFLTEIYGRSTLLELFQLDEVPFFVFFISNTFYVQSENLFSHEYIVASCKNNTGGIIRLYKVLGRRNVFIKIFNYPA